jgi:hypothetical protein
MQEGREVAIGLSATCCQGRCRAEFTALPRLGVGPAVRRPNDPSRNAATSVTRREQQEPDSTPPGEGEWLGGRVGGSTQ